MGILPMAVGWRRWLCPAAGLRVAQGAKPAHGKESSNRAQGGLGYRDCQGSRVTEDQGTSLGWESCLAAPSRVDGVIGRVQKGLRPYPDSLISSCHPSWLDWGEEHAERWWMCGLSPWKPLPQHPCTHRGTLTSWGAVGPQGRSSRDRVPLALKGPQKGQGQALHTSATGDCSPSPSLVLALSRKAVEPPESLRGHPGRQEVAGHQVRMLPNNENS